jgi:hypothetical protein
MWSLEQYYLADDTISIYEPPSRNSGIQGGKYLSREPVPRNPNLKSGAYRPADMFVGARIRIHDRTFELLRADDWTMNWMEENKQHFPMSDYDRVLAKVRIDPSSIPSSSVINL